MLNTITSMADLFVFAPVYISMLLITSRVLASHRDHTTALVTPLHLILHTCDNYDARSTNSPGRPRF
jgi:hypothetical protein